MRREYKGFYIEPANTPSDGYALYHVVTGNFAGTELTVRAAKEIIDEIHLSIDDYARYAGVETSELKLKRGRWVTKRDGE